MAQKTCIVTGGSRGIGLATALRFAAAGCNLVIAARRPGPLEQAAKQIQALGVGCEALPVDVGDAAGAREVIEVARRRFGRLDVLVNNAGVAPLAPLEATTDEAFDQALRTNIAAVFHVTRAAWPALRDAGGGVVVNISSVASVDPFPGFSVYAGCKAWVNMFTRAIAEEGRPHNIRAFAVAPGAVETDMLRGALPDYPAEQTLAPDAIARVIEKLCDEAFAHSSGQTIFVRK